MVPITEKLLQSAAGWQAFKQARQLLAGGRVQESVYEPPIVKGMVRDMGKTFLAGLKMNSATDMDNLCACRDSRERGMLCAHSIAVALASLGIKEERRIVASASSSSSERPQDTRTLSEEIPKARIE
ncbi:MAG: hypothetical protein ABIP32_10205, partial [Chthoniobacterales bacterium]